MKLPFLNYKKPYESDYIKRHVNEVFFSIYEPFKNDDDRYECDICGNEECIDQECEEYEENDPELFKLWDLRKKNKNLSLQDIINKLPDGVTPDQVKISVRINCNAFSVTGSEVNFSFTKEIPDDPEGFKKAQEEYEKNYQAYLVEKAKYDQWKKDQEIKELEEKLKELKK